MTIAFRCPTCSRLLRTSDEKAGLATRCPDCGGDVTIPEQVSRAVTVSERESSQDFEPEPSESSRDFLDVNDLAGSAHRGADISCPMCGAANEPSAPRCLACGEELWAVQGEVYSESRSRRFGSIWNEAWQRWKANLGIMAAATAIAGGLLTAVYVLMAFAGLLAGALIGVTLQPAGGEDLFVIVISVLIGGFYFVFFAVYAGLLAGLSKLALRITRYREAGLEAMMPSTALSARSVVCTLVILVVIVMAMTPGVFLTGYGLERADEGEAGGWPLVFLGYAAIYLAWGSVWGLFWPVPYFLVDETGIGGSLVRGFRMAVAHPLLSIQLAVTHLVLLAAGFATCYVAMLFTVPLSFVLFAVAYARCRTTTDSQEQAATTVEL